MISVDFQTAVNGERKKNRSFLTKTGREKGENEKNDG